MGRNFDTRQISSRQLTITEQTNYNHKTRSTYIYIYICIYIYIYIYAYSFWPEFQVGSDLYFLRWEAREDVYSHLTLGPLSSRSSVNTTTSTARRLQRQRAQDRALTQLARAHRRLSAHHGSADMSWTTKGKGKGYYQYIPGWVGEASSRGWDDAKGGGKGSKGQTSKGKGNSNHLTVDKDLL